MNGTSNGTSNGISKVHVHKSTIYLARHGESAANVSMINLPPEEDILTENGKCQADQLGKHLKDVEFTRAFASNYARARDTAGFVLANSEMKSNKPELKIDERIRERELGIFVGKPAGEAFKSLMVAVKKGTPMHKFELPGAETVAEFDGRIDSFLDDLFKELQESSKPETVLIVSHGLTILRLMTKLKEPSKGLSLQSWTFKSACSPMKNTSYHVFTVQVPAPDCPDKEQEKIHLEFLHYHQLQHLGNSQEAETHGIGMTPEQAGPIGMALLKLKEHIDDSPDKEKQQCALQ